MAYIIKPIVTEKMNTVSEKQNKFGFIVRPEANKIEIKAEVEAFHIRIGRLHSPLLISGIRNSHKIFINSTCRISCLSIEAYSSLRVLTL